MFNFTVLPGSACPAQVCVGAFNPDTVGGNGWSGAIVSTVKGGENCDVLPTVSVCVAVTFIVPARSAVTTAPTSVTCQKLDFCHEPPSFAAVVPRYVRP